MAASWALSIAAKQDRPLSSPIFTFLLSIGAVALVVNTKSDAGARDSGNASLARLRSAPAKLVVVSKEPF